MKSNFIIMLAGALLLCGFTIEPMNESSTGEKKEKHWTIGPFVRPEGANPVISPESTSFYCPMRKQQIKWEESDTFNPAATVKMEKLSFFIGRKTIQHKVLAKGLRVSVMQRVKTESLWKGLMLRYFFRLMMNSRL